MLLFASESNCWTPSASIDSNEEYARWLDPQSPLRRALERLGMAVKEEKGAAPNGAAKSLAT
jgi:hypothetical protein